MSQASTGTTVRLLIVEDDDGDALLVEEHFADADVPVDLMRARDGDRVVILAATVASTTVYINGC